MGGSGIGVSGIGVSGMRDGRGDGVGGRLGAPARDGAGRGPGIGRAGADPGARGRRPRARRGAALPLALGLLLAGVGLARAEAPRAASVSEMKEPESEAARFGVVAKQGYEAPHEATPAVRLPGDGVPRYRKDVYSDVYRMDRLYRSMRGPGSYQEFQLGEEMGFEEPELLWVTAYKAVMVTPDKQEGLSQEFMCHSNLNAGVGFGERFPSQLQLSSNRLFTLAQGQQTIELPEGFGIPYMSDRPVKMSTQALNMNVADREVDVRTKISITFVRDRDLEAPLKALVPRAIQAHVLVDGKDGYFGVSEDEVPEVEESGHEGCLIGEGVGGSLTDDGEGRTFAGFWVVPPGRQVNHSRVTTMLALPYDTTVHYIATHLHPFAESLELRDITTDETVYKAVAKQAGEGKIGLDEVRYFSSVEGIPLKKSHEYELVSTYNNTSDKDQDSMASMFLYLHAKDLYDFDFRPRAKTARQGG
jgi:hypothetical protein